MRVSMYYLTILVYAICSVTISALPADSSAVTDGLPPGVATYYGTRYTSLLAATGTVKPSPPCTTCPDKCDGRPSPRPIPPELQTDLNGQFKDGSWACMIDRSKQIWSGNEAQQQCINTCNANNKEPGHFNGTYRAIVCFGQFFPEPDDRIPILMQCPFDHIQLGKCNCDAIAVEFLINEAVTVILPKFGEAIGVLACELFTKPFTSLIQTVLEIPKDVASIGPDLMSFAEGVANLTVIDDAEALYDNFIKWLDPCRHVKGADEMSDLLDQIDDGFEKFWSAALTFVDGLGFLKIATKWKEWLDLGKDRPDLWPKSNKPTDKPASELPSESKKPSTPSPATSPAPNPTPGPTPTTHRAPSTKSSPTSPSSSSSSSTPAACLAKRDGGSAANAWKPGVLIYTDGNVACDDHITVTSITSIEFNTNKLSIHKAECREEWTQACYHYSSVIRADKRFETLTCPDRAGTTPAGRPLANHATDDFNSGHKDEWLKDKNLLQFDANNQDPNDGPDQKNLCQRDEYPPLYFLDQGNPIYDKHEQKVRLLPASENEGAGTMWGGMCWKDGIETDRKGIERFGNDPNPQISKKAFEPDHNNKRKRGSATITTSFISMKLNWAPAFSITAWNFENNYANDGLEQNPCIPRRLDIKDEGFPLLDNDPYVVIKQKRDPKTNPRTEYRGSIPQKNIDFYENTGKNLPVALFKREMGANLTDWDEEVHI